MADRKNASCTKPEEWIMGIALNSADPARRQTHSLLPRRNVDRSARIYQEDPQKTAGRSCTREPKDDGGKDMKKKNPPSAHPWIVF
jgi:hypothetical protein